MLTRGSEDHVIVHLLVSPAAEHDEERKHSQL